MKSGKPGLAALSFLSVALFCVSVLPRLLSYGMFFDGVTYASIARNMAEGLGSIWQPYYTDTTFSRFYDAPPLGIFLQSLAFRLVGDSLLVEAFWGFGAGLAILWLIWMIWRLDQNREESQLGGWVPLLLFVTLPLTSWLLSNNLLEGTMAVLTTGSGLLAVYALRANGRFRAAVCAFCAGVAVLAAVLVKGPVGFFPLAIPAIWFVTMGRQNVRRAVLVAATMLGGVIVPAAVLALAEPGFVAFVSNYVSKQVVASVSGSRGKVNNHFGIMYVVAREVVVPLLVGAVVWGIAKLKWGARGPSFSRRFWFYLLIGISGSLPIVLSSRQVMWYVFPSFPFYALAVAALFEAPFARLEEALTLTGKRRTLVGIIASVVFAGAVVGMIADRGAVRKVEGFHRDFTIQAVDIPAREVISVYPADLRTDWPLVANMQRQYKASLRDSVGFEYLLTTPDNQAHVDSLQKYERIHPPKAERYVLYKLRDTVPRVK